MNLFLASLIALLGGILGMILDTKGIMKHPAFFFLLGAITGIMALVVGLK